MREEQKKVIQKEMDRLKHLSIIWKGLTGYSSPVVLVKWKNQNLYQVCSEFHILNEKLVKINSAFPLVSYRVVIGYHLKRLPKSAKNFGVTELELMGLLVNIHGFMQLLCNRYFEVLVDHKAVKYMVKSKTESPTTRLKTLLLKLSEYTIELEDQKGSEMHTSDALSWLHNFTDTPDNKDVIPLNFLQHITPHYIEHSYSHFAENLYTHKTKKLDTTPIKQKHGRPPKPKPEIPISKTRTLTAVKTQTT